MLFVWMGKCVINWLCKFAQRPKPLSYLSTRWKDIFQHLPTYIESSLACERLGPFWNIYNIVVVIYMHSIDWWYFGHFFIIISLHYHGLKSLYYMLPNGALFCLQQMICRIRVIIISIVTLWWWRGDSMILCTSLSKVSMEIMMD